LGVANVTEVAICKFKGNGYGVSGFADDKIICSGALKTNNNKRFVCRRMGIQRYI
jgi:hypothetical protein